MPIQTTSYAVPRDDLAEAIREFDPSANGFVATDILPVREVKRKAATMSVLKRENMKVPDVTHSNGAAYNRVDMAIEDLAYACVDKGLEAQLTDDDRANYANDFDAELETVDVIAMQLYLAQEVRVKDLIFNTTTWTGDSLFTDNSGSPWDTSSTDIITQVNDAKEKVRINTGFTADSILIGEAALQNLLKNDDIVARFPGATLITEAMIRAALAAIFGLQNLFVGKRVYDGAKPGQAFSGTDIWGDDYAMIFKRQTGSTRSGGLGRTILWTDMTPSIAYAEQYREEQTKSDIFRVGQYLQEKVFDAYFGHLIQIDA